MDETFEVGRLPAGATIIRLAAVKDLQEDGSRVVLYRDKEGRHYWLCWSDKAVRAEHEDN